MKRTFLLLLSALTLNVGCGGCGKNKKTIQEPKQPDLPAAVRNEVIPSKATVTTVFFTVDDKSLFWMETINGTHQAKPEESFWTGQGVIVPREKAWRVYLADGTDYGINTAPGEGLTTVATILKEAGTTAPAGYEWDSEVGSNGMEKVMIKPAIGKRQRIGMYPTSPSEPVWKEATRPAARGTETPMLSRSAGFQMKADNARLFQNAPPTGSTAVAAEAAPAEDLATWGAALGALRNGEITFDLSQHLELDGDEGKEAFVCVTGGRGTPCYVIDKVGEEVRYYSTSIQWSAGNPELPQFFSVEKGTYIMHAPENAVTNRGEGFVRLVRFNGSGYVTETMQ